LTTDHSLPTTFNSLSKLLSSGFWHFDHCSNNEPPAGLKTQRSQRFYLKKDLLSVLCAFAVQGLLFLVSDPGV
jgi:hypothetical protein